MGDTRKIKPSIVIVNFLTILLHRLCAQGLSDRYVTWFRSYFSIPQSSVGILDTFSSPFEVLGGFPRGSALGPLLIYLLTTFEM